MAIFLNKINSVPVANSDFDNLFLQWLWVLVDSLNEDLSNIQDAFNLLTLTGFTQTQITDMNTAGDLDNGIFVYDTANDVYVGRQAGALVKFTTTPYP